MSTTSVSIRNRVSGSGFPRRSCPPGHGSRRRSPRFCRCCICTGCPPTTSVRLWSSSSAPAPGCRQRRSPGGPASGKTKPPPSPTGTSRAPITCICGSTASTSKCAWGVPVGQDPVGTPVQLEHVVEVAGVDLDLTPIGGDLAEAQELGLGGGLQGLRVGHAHGRREMPEVTLQHMQRDTGVQQAGGVRCGGIGGCG